MKRNRALLVPLAVVLTAGGPLVVRAGDHPDGTASPAAHAPSAVSPAPEGAPSEESVIADQLPTYPLATCVVSGEELGAMGKPVDFVYEGRLVRFCCPMCEKKLTADPAAYLAKIDAAVIEAQLPDYPLGVCPVSGKQLGAMGEPYDHVHGTKLVRFCCGGCLDAFDEDPAAYLAKIDAARAEDAGAEGD